MWKQIPSNSKVDVDVSFQVSNVFLTESISLVFYEQSRKSGRRGRFLNVRWFFKVLLGGQ